ncbi:carboxypeptidase-like regulatory domain-containing protein [Winogradskyella luteola]|uniref:TonB-dependent receptor plug domain-containing protein n=1 Tax=Winogradskyella luteola TaxID=2828330 RepID=A0A9X1F9M3_9FLAO|nr:carboxypeptidase-like regulatory domain-containing protein [Winogradskyella luteola]MBV7269714.1 TonB-dependent receptor plug domain-containing protein [Winogradskyella luteola]
MKHLTILLICFLMVFSISNAQQKTKTVIAGTVKDSLGQPVNNAIIFLDDSKTRKTTNKKGEFKIKVKKLPETVSAFSEDKGFETVSYDSIVSIKFNTNSLKKGEYVTFLAKYSNKKKNSSKNQQVFTNIYDYLRAMAPMLRISGPPENQIRVRGYDSSFNSSNEPLFIVNGNPTRVIEDIIPASIKSVSVLKDSSAAAYGARGANGVIIITTK